MQPKLIFPIIICLIINSCQKEKSNETSPNGTAGYNCKACEYIPMCDSSVYSYYDTLGFGSSTGITTDTMLYKRDTLIRGLIYQEFYLTGSQSGRYFNCNNGISQFENKNELIGGYFRSTMLDVNLPVNGTWSDTVLIPLVAGKEVHKKTIIAKGVGRIINSLSFSDVIHVEDARCYPNSTGGLIIIEVSDYYYAKGVGLIEVVTRDRVNAGIEHHRALKSYYIP